MQGTMAEKSQEYEQMFYLKDHNGKFDDSLAPAIWQYFSKTMVTQLLKGLI